MKFNCYFQGSPIVVTEHCGTFVPRRKHKKSRIQKKWLKKFGKKFEPSSALIITKICGNVVLFCHPKYFDKYKKIFTEKGGYTECPK